jgi:hypothetical protein
MEDKANGMRQREEEVSGGLPASFKRGPPSRPKRPPLIRQLPWPAQAGGEEEEACQLLAGLDRKAAARSGGLEELSTAAEGMLSSSDGASGTPPVPAAGVPPGGVPGAPVWAGMDRLLAAVQVCGRPGGDGR